MTSDEQCIGCRGFNSNAGFVVDPNCPVHGKATRVRVPLLSPPQGDATGSGTGGLTVRQGAP